MRDDHIIQLIEGRPPDKLSAAETRQVRAHTANCAECRQTYEAAHISTRLLRERASVTVEPPPFFHTRVLAAIREQNGGRRVAREAFGLQKMWQSARILITSMAIAVATLTAVSIFGDRTPFQSGGPGGAASPLVADNETAAAVIFEDDDSPNDEMTYSQVLTNLYDSEASETPRPEDSNGRQQ
jgi:hypothetical protein